LSFRRDYKRKEIMARIGVFVCHCGENISATVELKRTEDVHDIDVMKIN